MSQGGPPYLQGEAGEWDKEGVDREEEVKQGDFIHTRLSQGQSWFKTNSRIEEAFILFADLFLLYIKKIK